LRDGAEICTGSDDVLSSLGLLGFSPASEGGVGHQGTGADVDVAPGPAEAMVLELLADGPCTMDSLLSASGLDLVELSSVLAAMEAGSQVITDAGWVRRTS
jgi:predicted Rossmann fold nucleotide-binding protein DprA/Smf involved in DNA uptake